MNEDAEDDGRPWDGGVAAYAIKQPFLFFATGHSIYSEPANAGAVGTSAGADETHTRAV
jgi:hypothetical protein